jgi:nucleotide-binding universal stress UspA family protein
MLSSILVATDASPASNRAINIAADLAARYEARLHILHVVRDMQLPPALKRMAEVEKIVGEREDVLLYVAEKILDEAERRARRRGAREVERVIGRGDPAGAIVSQAKRRKVDAVVLGTRGLGKVKGVLLGSVSRKVANLAETNCFIVR